MLVLSKAIQVHLVFPFQGFNRYMLVKPTSIQTNSNGINKRIPFAPEDACQTLSIQPFHDGTFTKHTINSFKQGFF
jgi:hypothetical protein